MVLQPPWRLEILVTCRHFQIWAKHSPLGSVNCRYLQSLFSLPALKHDMYFGSQTAKAV